MTTAYVTHERYPEHDLPYHPEHAGRIRAVWQAIEAADLLPRLLRVTPVPATRAQLAAVHTDEYLDLLEKNSRLDRMVLLDADTYLGPTSYDVALLSAGGVIQAVDAVCSGQADNALACVRPPGHHAMPGYAMGFCIFGNVPAAVRHARTAYGLKRVMVMDYDVHHGNGTQAMFYDDPSVLFISSHQYPFYPGSGGLMEVGTGAGRGYTLNIPLPPGHGDRSFARLYEQIVWKAAERFGPELLVVSSGHDAHFSDPLAQMRLSLAGYDHLNRELIAMAKQLCGGKIVFVMEGGYNLDALGAGWANIARALLGESGLDDPLGPNRRDEPSIEGIIDQIKGVHGL